MVTTGVVTTGVATTGVATTGVVTTGVVTTGVATGGGSVGRLGSWKLEYRPDAWCGSPATVAPNGSERRANGSGSGTAEAVTATAGDPGARSPVPRPGGAGLRHVSPWRGSPGRPAPRAATSPCGGAGPVRPAARRGAAASLAVVEDRTRPEQRRPPPVLGRRPAWGRWPGIRARGRRTSACSSTSAGSRRPCSGWPRPGTARRRCRRPRGRRSRLRPRRGRRPDRAHGDRGCRRSTAPARYAAGRRRWCGRRPGSDRSSRMRWGPWRRRRRLADLGLQEADDGGGAARRGGRGGGQRGASGGAGRGCGLACLGGLGRGTRPRVGGGLLLLAAFMASVRACSRAASSCLLDDGLVVMASAASAALVVVERAG